MKRENMSIGLQVVIKPCATQAATRYVGMVATIEDFEGDCCWVRCGYASFYVYATEIRKLRDGDKV